MWDHFIIVVLLKRTLIKGLWLQVLMKCKAAFWKETSNNKQERLLKWNVSCLVRSVFAELVRLPSLEGDPNWKTPNSDCKQYNGPNQYEGNRGCNRCAIQYLSQVSLLSQRHSSSSCENELSRAYCGQSWTETNLRGLSVNAHRVYFATAFLF